MAETHTLISDLAAVTAVAAFTSVLARMLQQPLVVGYLVAGLIVGPYLSVPVFADPSRVHALAELGVVLVMFAVGLEFRVARLLQILPMSGFTGLVQVGALLWCGFSLGQLFGWTTEGSLFLGASLAISSTMVVTGVFADQEVDPDTRQHVLGVLVFQDVVAIVLIAAMTAVAAGQTLEPGQLLLTISKLGAVLIGLLVAGILVVPAFVRRATQKAGPATLAVVAVGLAFGFAAIAEWLGYSPALGAFVGGIVVAESGKAHEVEHVIAPLRDVFAAIFFVSVGMEVDPRVAFGHLHTSILVALVVIVAQAASVGFAGVLSGVPLRRALVGGLALGQIGEFSFILAGIGITAGVAPEALQPILVTVAAITAFTTPKLLGAGDRLVSGVARRMPHRLQSTLTLVEAWVDRLRRTGRTDHPLRGPLGSVALDGVVLVGLLAAVASTQGAVRGWLESALGWSATWSAVAVAVALLVSAAPFVYGLLRGLRVLAGLIARLVLPGADFATPAGRAAEQVVVAVVYFAAFLGIGAPGLAVIRPLVVGGLIEAVMLLGVVLGTSVLWRRMGAAEGELRSGATVVAQALARHAEAAASGTPPPAPPRGSTLQGLADVVQLAVEPGSQAVDATLAELDVRARTGATVVAIHTTNADVVLPTGHERLRVGDIVAMVGTDEAIALARRMLAGAPPPGAA